jgi:hypothetical protein
MDITNRKQEAEEQWIVVQLCEVAECVTPEVVAELSRLAKAYLSRRMSAEEIVTAAKAMGVKRCR